MTSPKISVICPVYKAEKYLHRCVDSILAQTFTDFELLLIDDGSPDRSGEICDEYAVKDSRVRVFHKENGGVSSARQCGIDNMTGEYSIHADPDDWVEPTMLEELYKKAKEKDADMVICDYYVEVKHKTKYVKQEPTSLESEQVLRDLFQRLHGSLWNKLIRSACYKENKIRFIDDINLCEDLLVNIQLLMNNIVISYLGKAFYYYDQIENVSSITRNINLVYYNQSECVFVELKKLLGQDATFNKGLNNKAIALLYNLILAGSSNRLFKEKTLNLGVNLQLSYNKKELNNYRYIIVLLADTVSFRFAKMLSYVINNIKKYRT